MGLLVEDCDEMTCIILFRELVTAIVEQEVYIGNSYKLCHKFFEYMICSVIYH